MSFILKGILGLFLLVLLIYYLGKNNILDILAATQWYVVPLLIFSILFIALLNAINFLA